MLGRPMRELELQLFTRAIEELVSHEYAAPTPAPGDV